MLVIVGLMNLEFELRWNWRRRALRDWTTDGWNLDDSAIQERGCCWVLMEKVERD